MSVDVEELADAIALRLAEKLDVRPLLSVREAGERLGVSERTAREIITAGELPTVMVKGSRKVEPAAIDRYIAAQKGAA